MPQATLEVIKERFGTMPDGSDIDAYTLKNSQSMSVTVITYGGIITQCHVPDRSGNLANVVLGFPNLEPYTAYHPRFGATIGRYANRIANAQFTLNGHTYKLAANKGTSCIHGGIKGFDKRLWKVNDTGSNDLKSFVKFSYHSPDMEEGFPGNLDVSITFSLDENNSFTINYHATTDKPTPINLTNHSYFNLRGAGNGNVLNHVANFSARQYTPLNSESVATGEIASVENTPFDFTTPTAIGAHIDEVPGGYDLNYVRAEEAGEIIGTVLEPESGRMLTVYTDQPAFQFFTANSLDGTYIGNGGPYHKHAGFCLETQAFPNSVNVPKFPNTILRPDTPYITTTKFSFTTSPD